MAVAPFFMLHEWNTANGVRKKNLRVTGVMVWQHITKSNMEVFMT